MSIDTEETTVLPTPPTSAIFDWIKTHFTEVRAEAKRRNIKASDFVVMMLDDALDAYKHAEVFDDYVDSTATHS